MVSQLYGQCSLQTCFLVSCNVDRLRIFQIFKFSFLFAWQFHHQFYKQWGVTKPLLQYFVSKSQLDNQFHHLQVLPSQNTRTRTQIFYHFRQRSPFLQSPVTCFSFLSETRVAFPVHISSNILFVYSPKEWKAFSPALFPLSFCQNHLW